MGTVKRIGDEYYIEFHARGLLYQQKAGPDLARAQQLLEEIEGKIRKGEMGTMVRDVERDVFFKTFIEENERDHYPKTWTRYLFVIKHFEKYMKSDFPGTTKLSQVTPKVIEHYRSFLVNGKYPKPDNKSKVINVTLYMLRDIFDYAIALGYLNDNPTVHVRFMEPKYSKVPSLSLAELTKLFSCSPVKFRYIIEFLIATGLTIGELIKLTWNDVDFENRVLIVNSYGRYRRIPIEAQAFSVLKVLRDSTKMESVQVFLSEDGSGLVKEKLDEQLAQCCNAAGVSTEISWQNFRRLFVQHLAEKGLNLINVYRLLGINDIVKVLRYESLIGPDIK